MSKQSLLFGVKKGIPIMLGYAPLGIAFGVVAREQGLDIWQTALLSLTAYTGSGQFIAVGMLGAGASISAILIANFLVNMRYLLFSASMAPYVKKMPTFIQSILAFGITDETFAVNMNQFSEREADRDFMLGVNFAAHFSWVANSALGAAVGQALPNIDRYGVSFALPAMFIALLVMQVKSRLMLWMSVLAGAVSLVLKVLWPASSTNIIIATILAATIGVMLCPYKAKSTS